MYQNIKYEKIISGNPSIVTEDIFIYNWKLLTKDLFNNFNWNNVLAAGGSILGCLLPGKKY